MGLAHIYTNVVSPMYDASGSSDLSPRKLSEIIKSIRCYQFLTKIQRRGSTSEIHAEIHPAIIMRDELFLGRP